MKRLLDSLEVVVLGILGVLFFQGKGSHSVFVAIAVVVPVLRFLIQKSYRVEWKKRYVDFRDGAERFRAQRKWAAVPVSGIFYFVVGPSLFFALVNGMNISSMDNYPTSAVAASIVLDRGVEISRFFPSNLYPGETVPRETVRKVCKGELPQNIYWVRCVGGGVYSAYPPGMILFALPPTFISYVLGGNIGNSHNQWRLAKWTAAMVEASTMGMFFLIALLFVPFTAAFVMTLILASGSTLLMVVGQALWTQGGVVWGLLVLLLTQLVLGKKSDFKIAVLQGLVAAFMVACRVPALVIVGPFFLWILIQSRAQFFIASVFCGVGLSLLGFYQWSVYTSPLGPQVMMASGFEIGRYIPSTFYGHLFSPGCGLFVYNPWVWMGFLLAVPSVRKRVRPYWKASESKYFWPLLLLACTLHMLVVSSWPGWWGAAWGPRYLVEIIPVIALSLLGVLHVLLQSAGGRRFVAVLVTLSFLIQVPGLFLFAGNWFYDIDRKIYPTMKDEEKRVFDWTNPPFLYPFRKNPKSK